MIGRIVGDGLDRGDGGVVEGHIVVNFLSAATGSTGDTLAAGGLVRGQSEDEDDRREMHVEEVAREARFQLS